MQPLPPRQVLYRPSSVPYRIVRSQTLVDCYLSGAVIAAGLSSASRRTTAHRPELAVVIVRHSHSSLLPAQAHRRHSQSPLFVDCCFWPACPCQRCRPLRHAHALSSLPSRQPASSFSYQNNLDGLPLYGCWGKGPRSRAFVGPWGKGGMGGGGVLSGLKGGGGGDVVQA